MSPTGIERAHWLRDLKSRDLAAWYLAVGKTPDPRTQAAIDAGHPEWVALPPSKKAARAASVPQYFTGRPCAFGHVSPRQRGGGNCIMCFRVWDRERYYREDVHEKFKKYSRERYYDPEVYAREAEYRARADVKARARLNARKPENIAKTNEYEAVRRASFLAALPAWLTADQRQEIRDIYDACSRRSEEAGEQYQVDHIIPLNHPDVCGLHVPWNLQVLTARDNNRKNNSFDGTMENLSWRVRPRPRRVSAAVSLGCAPIVVGKRQGTPALWGSLTVRRV